MRDLNKKSRIYLSNSSFKRQECQLKISSFHISGLHSESTVEGKKKNLVLRDDCKTADRYIRNTAIIQSFQPEFEKYLF